MKALLTLALLAGCERNLLADLHDAALDAPADAAVDVPLDALAGCPTPAQPLAAGMHEVYLNTDEGVMVMPGSNDAPANSTNIITTPATIPAFLSMIVVDPATRKTFIDQIAQAVQQALAPYSIDVVTTRPDRGPYDMVVLGGDATTIMAVSDAVSVTTFSCTMPQLDAIDFVFDFGLTSPLMYANEILDDLGLMLGAVASTQPGDCECRFDTGCAVSSTTLCTFGSNVPTTSHLQSSGQPLNCGIMPTEDEPALLKATLGCR